MKNWLVVIAMASLGGCATNSSGVAPLGDGQYLLSGTDLTGWRASGEVKAALLKEAAAHCAKQGKELTGVQLGGAEAGFIRAASGEVRFRCK